jgi:hypothetical protein
MLAASANQRMQSQCSEFPQIILNTEHRSPKFFPPNS